MSRQRVATHKRCVAHTTHLPHLYLSILTILILACLLVYLVETKKRGLCFNKSKSLPQTVFFSSLLTQIERGKYVSFKHPNFPGTIVKQIVGLPGDPIQIRQNQIFVNEYPYGHLKKYSPSGIKLDPLNVSTIPEGHLFVHATHEESFDSRYEQFGLIQINWLQEELCPLF